MEVSGSGDESPLEAEVFVNECLKFDVLEEKLVKRQITTIKIRVG